MLRNLAVKFLCHKIGQSSNGCLGEVLPELHHPIESASRWLAHVLKRSQKRNAHKFALIKISPANVPARKRAIWRHRCEFGCGPLVGTVYNLFRLIIIIFQLHFVISLLRANKVLMKSSADCVNSWCEHQFARQRYFKSKCALVMRSAHLGQSQSAIRRCNVYIA